MDLDSTADENWDDNSWETPIPEMADIERKLDAQK